MLKNEYPESYNSHDVENMGVKELDDLLDFLDSMQNKANGGMMLDNTKTYHQANDYTAPPDLEVMIGYANGGGVGSMMQPKKKKFEDQRLTKKVEPANQGGGPNYLGKQKEVTVPKKWLSSPDHVVAELAYITPREQKILLDANIYGSLKGKPNKGPGGIMSLQGDLGGWSSGAGKGGNTGGDRDKGKGGSSREDYKQSNYYKMMTGTGTTATSPTGDTVRSKKIAEGSIPEYAYGPDGKPKYIGAGGQWVGKSLFNPSGYRDIQNRRGGFFGFGGQKDIRFNPVTRRYEFEEEGTGDVKPGMGGRIFGGLMSLLTGIPLVGGAIGTAYDYGKGIFKKKPRDMSQYNELGLFGKVPEDFNRNRNISTDMGDSVWKDGTFTWGGNNKVNNVNNVNNVNYPGDDRITQSTTDGRWSNINDYLEQDISSNVVSDNGVVNTDSFANWNVDDEAMYP